MELLSQQSTQTVKAAIKGDTASFEQLVQMYQNRVYSLSLRLTGAPQDAEDLAQEVFVKAYRFMGSFRTDSDFGTWLHRIAINTWLNRKRKITPVAAFSLDESIGIDDGEVKREIADFSGDPEKVYLDTQMSERLQRAVESLPKEQKAVILLREVEDYSYEEIAQIMDCSVGTVRSRLSRARDALRKCYNGLTEI